MQILHVKSTSELFFVFGDVNVLWPVLTSRILRV